MLARTTGKDATLLPISSVTARQPARPQPVPEVLRWAAPIGIMCVFSLSISNWTVANSENSFC